MRALAVALALSMSGCAFVHSYNVDTIAPESGTVIVEEAEKTIWFRMNFDNQFVDEAYDRFMAKCPGTLHSVTSRLSSENSFLHWYSRVRFSGVCVKAAASPSPSDATSSDGTTGTSSVSAVRTSTGT